MFGRDRLIVELLQQLNRKVDKIMGILDDLTAKVANQTTVDDSIIALVQGLKQKLDALAAQPSVDPAQLAALSQSLSNEQAKIVAAVTANTPASAT